MPRRPSSGLGGLVLVDKPVGPSSFRVTRDVGKAFADKAGHAGTLDPRASGLLLVCVGQSTRLAQFLVGLPKRYLTEIRLGLRTSTGDAEGEEIERGAPPADIEAAVAALVGEIELPIPAASAVKIDGERAYKLHRAGVDVEMPSRRSQVFSASIVEAAGDRVTLDLQVSSGTYIRAIADHLGGHCASLRRTEVGPFRVADADAGRLLAPLAALPFLPEVALDDEQGARLVNGRSVDCPLEGTVALTFRGSLVAVARASGGQAHPETVLKAGFGAGR